MSVTVAGIEFEHHHYDARGDVLYLNVAGYERYGGLPPAAHPTPEGHNVEYDERGRVISLVLVNVRWLLEREGELQLTWPAAHLKAADLDAALPSVA